MGDNQASLDVPFGLLPWRTVRKVELFALVTAIGTAVYRGVMMEVVGTSIATKHGNRMSAAPEETGAAGSLLGPVVGLYDEDMFPVEYIASGRVGDGVVAGYALISVDRDQEYVVREDGDTSSLVAANIGLNVNLVGVGGNTTTGRSTQELDSDSVNSTATLALKILGVHPDDLISATGAAGNHARFIVKINTPFYGDAVVGV